MTRDEQKVLLELSKGQSEMHTDLKWLRDINEKHACHFTNIEHHLDTLNGNVARNAKNIAILDERCQLLHPKEIIMRSSKIKKIGIPSGAFVILLYIVYSLGVIVGWWPPLIG